MVSEHLSLRVLETTDPSLEEQLRTVRDKLSDEATILNMEKHYRSFMTKYSSRVDPEGAWLAYRLLVGKIASVLSMYRLGKTRPGSGGGEGGLDISSSMLKADAEAAAMRGRSSNALRARTPPSPSTRGKRSVNTSNSPSRPQSRESPDLMPERSVDRLIVSVGAAAADAMGGPPSVIKQKSSHSRSGMSLSKVSVISKR
eukprot:jgi/Tetstr1/464388/TSEL_009181.t1